jgi:hypothetical protein
MELSDHQRPLKRHDSFVFAEFCCASTGCGHIMVTAAAIAAASSSEGMGVIEPTLTFIA